MEDHRQIDKLVAPLMNPTPKHQANGVDSTSSNLLHDPYYLHPSEGPGTVLVKTHLTGGNYHLLAQAMKVALKSKNKLKFVDRSIKKLDEEDLLFVACNRVNTIVLAWISNSLSLEIYHTIHWVEEVSVLWRDLCQRYHQGDLYRIVDLQGSLYSLKEGDTSITKYFT